jgi:peptide chain release factor 1
MQILKLEKAHARFLELEELLADPKVIADQNQYQKLAKEYSDLTPLVQAFRDYKNNEEQIQGLKEMLSQKHDADFEELAKVELVDLESKQESLRIQIEDLLNPKKQTKEHAMIIEIRAGTGGEEASLFAGDLYRMYCRYADKRGWKVELMSSAVSDTKGFKEVVFSISGKEAEARLKWESGAHRVQRVPTTEASGRIHTSAATVAVMQEPEEVDIQINPSDLKIDVYRSSGPGGQSVNTTDSAVRITHLPTGVIVACQDERSQLKNRAKAMRVLRARLMDHMEQENMKKISQDRKAKIGTGDRSEKIRTYNFPDHRVTDHRIGFTTHQLHAVLDGDMDELTDALIKAEEESEAASGS